MKKVLSVSLAVVMMLALLSGCSAPAAIASQCIGVPAPAEYRLPV
mgnify:FL=1